jgi:PAS domain S-box-containing protein
VIRTFTAPPRKPLPVAARYGASLALVAAASTATMELPNILEPMRFLFFWAAVLLATLIGGTGPGLLAVVLTVAAAAVLEFPWQNMVSGFDHLDVLRIAIYAVWASAISVAVGLRDAANRRVDLLREWLATTLNSIGDGVIVTDAKGAIVFLNPVAAALTGWSLDEAADRAVTDIFNVRKEETLETIENPVSEALRTGRAVLLEDHAVLFDRAGRTIPIDDSAAPIRSNDETIRGVVLVFRDVTRRRAAEKALLQADAAKDQFLATLSHDLRTPLTAILGWTRLLREGLNEENREEALDTIEANATAQADLIDDILDLTRIASGKIILDRVNVDLVSLLRDAAVSMQPACSAKNISLDMSLPPQEAIVSADRKRLRQIVWNLISNAIKFSPEGGRIQVELKNGDGVVELNVIDEGIGIDSGSLPRVFERFQQAHGAQSVKLGGLGLGLAIVKDLAQLHGGTVTAFSKGRGSGATFTVRLPHSAAVNAVS